MDQALRMEVLSRFQHTVSRMHACMEHPADAPTVVLDPDGMVSAFEDFLSYLMQDFPSPSTGDLESHMGVWRDTCVEDWAAGKIDIEAGWVPAFLVRKLIQSVTPHKMPPTQKAQSWSLFVAKYAGFVSKKTHRYSLPQSGKMTSEFESGTVVLLAKPWGITQRSITAVFVEHALWDSIDQHSLENLNATALPKGWHLLCQNQLINPDEFHEMVLSCFNRADTLGLLNTKG